MNNSNNHRPESLSNIEDSLLKKRRAFMKGSAGIVPIVLTLRSGSAFAIQSISCLQKLRDSKPSNDKLTSNTDNWLRIPTTRRQMTDPNGSIIDMYQVPSSPISGVWTTGSNPGSTPAITLTNAGGWFDIANDNSGTPIPINGSGWKLVAGSEKPCYILLQINLDGSFSGLVGFSADFPYATGSCYTSIA